MVPKIAELFNETIRNDAAKRFGADMNTIEDLGGFESHVFEFKKNGKSYILKVTHTVRRSLEYVMGELEFINHLNDGGLTISRAIESESGILVEEIPVEDGTFLAYVFTKAKGALITERDWNADLFNELGQVTGKIHKLSGSFKPSRESYKREIWYDDYLFSPQNIIPAQHDVIDKTKELIDRIKAISYDNTSFGLGHGDLHQKNFFISNGILSPFDFDDSVYHYNVNDIAVSLYYLFKSKFRKGTREEFQKFYLDNYLAGYEKEYHIEDKWLKLIPDLMMHRHLLLYIVFYERMSKDKLTEKKDFFAKWKKQILEEIPVVSYD